MTIDVAWVAVIVAFSVGTLIGAVVMAVLAVSGHETAYRQGMAECPRLHEWEDIG